VSLSKPIGENMEPRKYVEIEKLITKLIKNYKTADAISLEELTRIAKDCPYYTNESM
jgi:hypothetical protein